MTKETRIVVRLCQEDKDWLAAQGEMVGVGDAVVARILISYANRASITMYQVMAWMAADAKKRAAASNEPTRTPMTYEQGPAPLGAGFQDDDEELDDAAGIPEADVDAIVAQKLAAAEANGSTAVQPRAIPDDFGAGVVRELRPALRQAGKEWASR